MRETTQTILVRLDERLKNLIDSNHTEHVTIIGNQETLRKHVNDENEKMDKRMRIVEDHCTNAKVTWKVLAKIGVTTITVIGLAVSIIKVILGV
jgi:siroheme synthase (precorrin-2 oxidase/ferrochelatase)